jgi:transposase
VELVVEPGKKVLRRNVTYLGRVRGNLAGYWAEGLDEPVWVFSNLEPEKALEIYRGRMKIEQSFRDLKGLLGLEKAMPKKLENLEKLIAFMLLAYAVGLLVGETIRAELHEAYSGLFILLKHRLKLRLRQFLRLIRLALDRFRAKRLRRLALSYLLSEGQKAPCPERFPCKKSGG